MTDINTIGQAHFVGSRPVRAFIICEDLPPVSDINQIPRATEVFLNPESISFNPEAVWADLDIPGLSHQVHQYSHSKSDDFSFTLVWDRLLASRRAAQLGIRQRINMGLTSSNPYIQALQAYPVLDPYQYKDFIRGLTVPMEPGYAPSRVTLVWPRFLHITGIVKKTPFIFNRFSSNGYLASFSVNIQMTEFRTVFRKRVGATQFFWDTLSNASQENADVNNNVEKTTGYKVSIGEAEPAEWYDVNIGEAELAEW